MAQRTRARTARSIAQTNQLAEPGSSINMHREISPSSRELQVRPQLSVKCRCRILRPLAHAFMSRCARNATRISRTRPNGCFDSICTNAVLANMIRFRVCVLLVHIYIMLKPENQNMRPSERRARSHCDASVDAVVDDDDDDDATPLDG